MAEGQRVSKPARMGAWARFRRSRGAVVSSTFILFLMGIAYLAPLLANNKPLAIRYRGRLHFTAFRDLFPLNHLLDPDPVALRLRKDPEWLFRTAGEGEGLCILPPVPYSPLQTDLGSLHRPPKLAGRHWLGCDDMGRDVLARLLHGAKVSLLVGFLAVGIATLIGLLLGGLAGYFGSWVDGLVISRLVEVMMCFPTFFFILTVVAVMDARYLNVWTIMLIIGVTSWPAAARYARAEFMRLKESDFVVAARALGAGHLRVTLRHILPNALTPLVINAAFGIAGAILLEAALSFLGVGVQPPEPSWGNVLSQVTRYWDDWWMGVFPGAAIFLTVLSYNRMGEGVRDALDPRSHAAA